MCGGNGMGGERCEKKGQQEVAYVFPCVESVRKAIEEDGPIHDRGQERKGDNGRIEHAMQHLQRSWPHVQPTPHVSRPDVRESMGGADGKVECQAPVSQIGEIAETVPRLFGEVVAVVPAEYEEDYDKSIERNQGAEDRELKGG